MRTTAVFLGLLICGSSTVLADEVMKPPSFPGMEEERLLLMLKEVLEPPCKIDDIGQQPNSTRAVLAALLERYGCDAAAIAGGIKAYRLSNRLSAGDMAPEEIAKVFREYGVAKAASESWAEKTASWLKSRWAKAGGLLAAGWGAFDILFGQSDLERYEIKSSNFPKRVQEQPQDSNHDESGAIQGP